MWRAAGALLLWAAGAAGQAERTFEVASLKPHPGPMPRMGISFSGPRLNGEAQNLRSLVMFAYNLKNYQLYPKSTPLPGDDVFYDVVAKAEGDGAPARDEFRQMMQSLLVERFHLKVHREMREMAVYALVVGKNGPKLKASATDASEIGHLDVAGRNYVVTRAKATMEDVVAAVANSFLDHPVVDRTGLTGTYDLKLTFTPNIRANREGEPDPADISIFTAVQEQLGLKLETQKAMIDVLVVDHAELPTGN